MKSLELNFQELQNQCQIIIYLLYDSALPITPNIVAYKETKITRQRHAKGRVVKIFQCVCNSGHYATCYYTIRWILEKELLSKC